jgi:DNA-binding IclR family transcriptional regulator
LAIGQIVSLLKQKPLTTAEIADATGLTPSEVSKLLNASARQKFIKFNEDLKRYALA